MNGRDLESSELGLPGENVETPIADQSAQGKEERLALHGGRRSPAEDPRRSLP